VPVDAPDVPLVDPPDVLLDHPLLAPLVVPLDVVLFDVALLDVPLPEVGMPEEPIPDVPIFEPLDDDVVEDEVVLLDELEPPSVMDRSSIPATTSQPAAAQAVPTAPISNNAACQRFTMPPKGFARMPEGTGHHGTIRRSVPVVSAVPEGSTFVHPGTEARQVCSSRWEVGG
jgi:hypothetical protein